MRRKLLCACVLVAAGFGLLVVRAEDADMQRKLFLQLANEVGDDSAHFENLTTVEKKKLIEAGNRELADSRTAPHAELLDPFTSNLFSIITLSGLGDKQAAEFIADEFERTLRIIGFTGSEAKNGGPALIEALAKRVFRNEPYEVGGSDSAFYPASHSAALGMLATLRHSPQFDVAVRRWALEFESGQLSSEAQANEMRGIVREWWRENEPLFKAEQFAEVKPGRPPDPFLRPVPLAMTPAEPPEQPRAQEPLLEAPSPADAAPPSASKVTNGLLLGALGLALAIAGLLIFWKRRT